MAFDGPGPELINGRLAMLGFGCIIFGEAVFDVNTWEMMRKNEFWFVSNTIIWTIASLEPMLRGGLPVDLKGTSLVGGGVTEPVRGPSWVYGFTKRSS